MDRKVNTEFKAVTEFTEKSFALRNAKKKKIFLMLVIKNCRKVGIRKMKKLVFAGGQTDRQVFC